jgi:hypothetical protein
MIGVPTPPFDDVISLHIIVDTGGHLNSAAQLQRDCYDSAIRSAKSKSAFA